MIYDTEITILKLRDGEGIPKPGNLEKVFLAFCGEEEVYHKRFWEAVAAYSRVDRLVELPLHRNVEAGMFAKYKGHVYSIEQAQFGKDKNDLPITTLSLKRAGVQYDLAAV